jgi:hypothetical protein
MIPNTSITIYNKYVDPTTRTEQWKRTVINNVVWVATQAISQSKDGQMMDNSVNVLMQQSAAVNYVDTLTWQALVTKGVYWTLQNGDYMVRGAVTDEISSSFTISQLKAKYNEVVMITAFNPKNQGSISLRHFQVDAK